METVHTNMKTQTKNRQLMLRIMQACLPTFARHSNKDTATVADTNTQYASRAYSYYLRNVQ